MSGNDVFSHRSQEELDANNYVNDLIEKVSVSEYVNSCRNNHRSDLFLIVLWLNLMFKLIL